MFARPRAAGCNIRVEGEKIYLRPLAPSDATSRYASWMNDRVANQFLESRFKRWTPARLRHYMMDLSKSGDNLFFAIVFRDDDRHIGNIKIGPINNIHKHAEVGIIIGEKDYWGKGIATEAIRLAVRYCFRNGIRRLFAGAYEKNTASIKAFKNAGFKIEGSRRKHFLYKGSYVDGVMLGINMK